MSKIKLNFYSFSALDEENKHISGIIDAPNKKIAHLMLSIIGVKKIKYLLITLPSYKKTFLLNLKEKLHLFSNLSMLVNSGLSIIDSLNTLKFEAITFRLKYNLFLILKSLKEGHRLSDSLKNLRHHSFSSTEISMIKIAEMSGTLDSSLKFIDEKLQNQLIIRQKIISASIYPCITLSIVFVVIFIVFNWVLPQFFTIFSQNKHELPWITKVIFSCARHISNIYGSILIITAIAYISLKLLIKYKKIPAIWHEKILLNIPIFGKIMLLTNRINFCYTMFTLLSAGIPLHDAIKEAIHHIHLSYSKQILQQVMTELITGKNFSTVLKKTPFFPRSAIQTLSSAENTGNLDDAFKLLYQRFSNDLSVFSDHIGKIIEPFIIILLGSIIGSVVIAIYLPIFQLGSLY